MSLKLRKQLGIEKLTNFLIFAVTLVKSQYSILKFSIKYIEVYIQNMSKHMFKLPVTCNCEYNSKIRTLHVIIQT